ncbi:MAG: hypothetical protein KDE14_03155 [Rhodobacteraceae bacterium]|nr:hypothetical protein [Paracoccaceae bacterium]
MSRRILYAWELGGGAGHVMRIKPIAEALRARGAAVTVAARNLASARPLSAAGFDVVPAPRMTHGLNLKLQAFNYAEILVRAGYGQAENVGALIAHWRGLINSLHADLVIADFAPGALLGARAVGVAAATVGTGFALPPPGSPLPSIRPRQTPKPDHPKDLEDQVFADVCAALAPYNAAAAPDLASFFNTGHDELCVFRELDHVTARGNGVNYAGPVFSSPESSSTLSPAPSIDVFAYLDGAALSFETMIKGLAALNKPTLAVVRGQPKFDVAVIAAPSLKITSQPVAVPQMLRAAKVAVCHGGIGLVSQALLAGVPLAIRPENPEQGGTGLRVEALGAGKMIDGPLAPQAIAAEIGRIGDDPQFAQAASAFAARHTGYDVSETVSGIVDRLLQEN